MVLDRMFYTTYEKSEKGVKKFQLNNVGIGSIGLTVHLVTKMQYKESIK